VNARAMLAAAIAALMFGTAFAPAATSSSDEDRKIGVCVFVRELDPDDRTCVLVPRPSLPALP
jgi:hypothetical protein